MEHSNLVTFGNRFKGCSFEYTLNVLQGRYGRQKSQACYNYIRKCCLLFTEKQSVWDVNHCIVHWIRFLKEHGECLDLSTERKWGKDRREVSPDSPSLRPVRRKSSKQDFSSDSASHRPVRRKSPPKRDSPSDSEDELVQAFRAGLRMGKVKK